MFWNTEHITLVIIIHFIITRKVQVDFTSELLMIEQKLNGWLIIIITTFMKDNLAMMANMLQTLQVK